MNWMTSAKNRIQCSKSKRNNDLRMIASSKLSSASSNFFSCREKESNQDIIPFAFTLQSKDMLLVQNITRQSKKCTIAESPIEFQESGKNDSKEFFDPLIQLKISPPKSTFTISNSCINEGQHIIFFNDGELCDELGHIQLNTESPTRPRQLQLEQTSSVEILATRALAHAELSSSNAYYVGWWTRVMSLLEDSLNGAQLEEVQYQLRAAEALGTDTTMDAAVVTSPRKALNGLYCALSKIGSDDRVALAIFDAIRLLEQIDKQNTDELASQTYFSGTSEPRENSALYSQDFVVKSSSPHETHMKESVPAVGAAAVSVNICKDELPSLYSCEGDWDLFCERDSQKLPIVQPACIPPDKCRHPVRSTSQLRKRKLPESVATGADLRLEDFF